MSQMHLGHNSICNFDGIRILLRKINILLLNLCLHRQTSVNEFPMSFGSSGSLVKGLLEFEGSNVCSWIAHKAMSDMAVKNQWSQTRHMVDDVISWNFSLSPEQSRTILISLFSTPLPMLLTRPQCMCSQNGNSIPELHNLILGFRQSDTGQFQCIIGCARKTWMYLAEAEDHEDTGDRTACHNCSWPWQSCASI